jgi:hypothetical protein
MEMSVESQKWTFRSQDRGVKSKLGGLCQSLVPKLGSWPSLLRKMQSPDGMSFPGNIGQQPNNIRQATRRYWANNQALLGKQPGNIGQTTRFFPQNGSACNSAIIQYQSGSLSFVKALPGS